MYDSIITAQQLHELVATNAENLVILDSSYVLSDPERGREYFKEAHIPHARYIDIGTDLSASQYDEHLSGGRHPLPTREKMAETFGSFGITPDTQVVAYDRNAAGFSARAWWMLNFIGHEAVAVLDGDLGTWSEAGYPLESGADLGGRSGEPYPLGNERVELWTTKDVQDNLDVGTYVLLDMRSPQRYRGEFEPFDPRAGHIPGARSRPLTDVMAENGGFHPADVLKHNIVDATKGYGTDNSVVYCGSGINATMGVLAAKIAGTPLPVLYAGSFSEWSRNEDLPINTGSQP